MRNPDQPSTCTIVSAIEPVFIGAYKKVISHQKPVINRC